MKNPTSFNFVFKLQNCTLRLLKGKKLCDVNICLGKKEAISIVISDLDELSKIHEYLFSLLSVDKLSIEKGYFLFSSKKYGNVDLKKKETLFKKIFFKEIGVFIPYPKYLLSPYRIISHQMTDTIGLDRALPMKEKIKLAQHYLEICKVENPKSILSCKINELTFINQLKTTLAIALCKSPTLLIATICCETIKLSDVKELLSIFKNIKEKQGIPIIFFSKEITPLVQIADRSYIFYNYRLIESGPSKEVVKNPVHTLTKSIVGSAPPLSLYIDKLPTWSNCKKMEKEKLTIDTLFEQMSIKKEKLTKRMKHIYTQSALYKVIELKYHMAEKNICFDNITFHVNKEEIVGILTQTPHASIALTELLALIRNNMGGKIEIMKKNLLTMPTTDIKKIREHFQFIFENFQELINVEKTTSQLLWEQIQDYQIIKSDIEKRDFILDITRKVHLSQFIIEKPIITLPRELWWNVYLAFILITKPKIIIIGNCFSKYNITYQAEMINLLKEIQKVNKLSFLYISTNFRIMRVLCDRVLLLKNKIEESVFQEQLNKQPQNKNLQKEWNGYRYMYECYQ